MSNPSIHHHKTARLWLVRWLFAATIVHFLVGAILPWWAQSGHMAHYFEAVAEHFSTSANINSDHALQIWWVSLFGATIQTVGWWMLALVYLGARHRLAFAWGSLALGLIIWAPQDMWISAQADMWINVWIDALALITLLPPLFWLWREDNKNGEANAR